jgi:hypothetical protein
MKAPLACAIPFRSQKNWLCSIVTERTPYLWFPFVLCLLQAVITVCVPCSWWCIKQNDGNKLLDARPSVDQALFEYTGHNFYIHGSVHRNSILIRPNEMQQYAGVYLLQNYSTCFRVSIAPIIRSTSNCNCSFWYRSYHVSEQQPSASVA